MPICRDTAYVLEGYGKKAREWLPIRKHSAASGVMELLLTRAAPEACSRGACVPRSVSLRGCAC